MNPSDTRYQFEQPRAGAWGTPPTQPPEEVSSAMPGRAPKDPGSKLGAILGWTLFLVCIITVVLLNQLGARGAGKAAGNPQSQVVDDMDPFGMNARMVVKLVYAVDPEKKEKGLDALYDQIEGGTKVDADRVRAAMVLADLKGDEAASKYLEAAKIADKAPYNEDAAKVQEALSGQALAPAEERALTDRYGWFAKVFFSRNQALTSSERQALVGHGGRLLGGLALAGVAIFIAFVGGLAAGVVMLVQIFGGKIRRRFVPPMPGGSVFIETVGVFVASFLVLIVVKELLVGAMGGSASQSMTVGLAAQWALVITPLYPLLRGMKFGEWRRAIGWHSGRGVWREIGAGLFGYFASLPILGVALLVTLALSLVVQQIEEQLLHRTPEPPANPIAELVSGGSALQLLLIFVLATVWAPLVEESIFRGALYRHLRGRVGVWVAVPVSGLCFGIMHGYSGVLLIPVITIGVCFALIREWRGSLIPTVVAHSLHNATILGIVMLIFGGIA
ncbi:MAG: type II CAAX endopeptidase family protein [Phycisphaerales bacterium]|jgi:membrane protease YdiL (CAAX protease family)